MGDLSKPTPARPDLEVRLAALRGYKMTWQETLAQKRSFIRGETGATDDDLRVTMPELFADVEVAERDAEIARLRAELSAAVGYMRNARIDLETGATKATAIRTISGGLSRAERALIETPAPEDRT